MKSVFRDSSGCIYAVALEVRVVSSRPEGIVCFVACRQIDGFIESGAGEKLLRDCIDCDVVYVMQILCS